MTQFGSSNRGRFGPSGSKCPESVARALERAVELGERDIQVAAYVGGTLVVDAWIGDVDSSTLFPVFSVTKAVAITALHLQAERGVIDYLTPVADYWPEFGRNGKGSITIDHVLTHRSGVPHLPPSTTLADMADWDLMCAGIAELEALYPPGTKSTYQARSMGWIVGEVVRRTDPLGRSFAEFLQGELLEPLGMRDTWVGLPLEQEHRLVPLEGSYAGPAPSETPTPERIAAYGSVTAPEIYADRRTRGACLPASGAITTANSLVRMWSMLAQRGSFENRQYLSPQRVTAFRTPRSDPYEFDEVIGLTPLIGVGGYWLSGPAPEGEAAVGDTRTAICHPGAGGSIAWADLETGVSAAVCHSRLFTPSMLGTHDEHPFLALGAAIRSIAG